MTERDALAWIKDILIILILLAVLAGVVIAILNINNLFSVIGMLKGPNGNNSYQNPSGNPYYNNPSGNQNYSNQSYYPQNNSQDQIYQSMSDAAIKLKNAVDQGDWSTADSMMRIIDSVSSQLPQGIQSLLPQLDQAIRNRDKAAFDSLYAQAQSVSPKGGK